MSFALSLARSDYWLTSDSERHHKARLVCLNKVFPKIGTVEQFRPIVVCSPVIKFMEGYIKPSLNFWMVNRMPKSQYGFRPGRGIEDARFRLLSRLADRKKRNLPVYVAFIDMSSAYNYVDRVVL